MSIAADPGRRLDRERGGYSTCTHLRIPIAVAARRAVHDRRCSGCCGRLVGTAFDVGDMPEATRIEFSRMRRDTEVATKRDEKVERERPPPTPEMPRMAFSAGGIDNNVAQLTPIVDARGAMSRMTMSAGSDRDVIPLVRIDPGLSAARAEPRARRLGAGAVHDHGDRHGQGCRSSSTPSRRTSSTTRR